MANELIFTFLLGLWLYFGTDIIDVGWRWKPLVFGIRLPWQFGEGIAVTPIPFSKKIIDCRKKPVKLPTFKAFTSDGVEMVVTNPSLVKQVIDLDKYLDLDSHTEDTLMDDVIDQNIRQKIRGNSFDVVAGMKFDIDPDTNKKLEGYGLKVWEIVMPQVMPADAEFARAVELLSTEKKQREGQSEEANHIIEMTNRFRDQGGYSQSSAEEMAAFVTGKANPKNVQGFTINRDIVEGLAAILRRS